MSKEVPYLVGWNARPGRISGLQVLSAAVFLVLVRLSLIALGFQRTAMLVNRLGRMDDPQENFDPALVRSSNYIISLAAAFVPIRLLCLERSLVLYYQLRRKRVPATLRMGVRAVPFEAHAWAELAGEPLNENPDRLKDFQPIFELS